MCIKACARSTFRMAVGVLWSWAKHQVCLEKRQLKQDFIMIIDRHSLAKELPEFKDKIHELKMNDRHFARLFDDYHDLDHEVIRIEEGVENTSDEYLESLKKQRLHLKDQLYSILKSAS